MTYTIVQDLFASQNNLDHNFKVPHDRDKFNLDNLGAHVLFMWP